MKYLFIIPFLFGFYLLFVGFVQWVWQQVAVAAFNAPDLTFWQTAGLLFLIGLVTNGFRAATGKNK